MMETSLLSQSPWGHDPLGTINILQDFPLPSFCSDQNERIDLWNDATSNDSQSKMSTLSSASSECDDDLLPICEELGMNYYENELFDNLGGWISGPHVQDQICGSSDWNFQSVETSSSSDSISSSSSCNLPRTTKQSVDILSNDISWSKMDVELQMQTVEKLTELISSEMDLREQLEIIRIIDSDAVISPTDTEFAINLNCLNDEKLEKFRAYVNKCMCKKTKSNLNDYVRNESKSTNSNQSQSNIFNRHKTSKREIAKERKNQIKAAKQRQKKEYKQLLKEKKSGLFVREEVLALSSTSTPDEDEDIDIGEDIC